MKPGIIVILRKLRNENSMLKREDLKLVQMRDIIPSASNQVLHSITRAAWQTSSFMSGIAPEDNGSTECSCNLRKSRSVGRPERE
mgnify:FL=1